MSASEATNSPEDRRWHAALAD